MHAFDLDHRAHWALLFHGDVLHVAEVAFALRGVLGLFAGPLCRTQMS